MSDEQIPGQMTIEEAIREAEAEAELAKWPRYADGQTLIIPRPDEAA